MGMGKPFWFYWSKLASARTILFSLENASLFRKGVWSGRLERESFDGIELY